MPAFEHFVQRQIAQVSYRRIGHIGPQRSPRINILEKIVNGLPDTHFVPDAHTHRRAFFSIDRIAPQVFLIQTRIDLVIPPE